MLTCDQERPNKTRRFRNASRTLNSRAPAIYDKLAKCNEYNDH